MPEGVPFDGVKRRDSHIHMQVSRRGSTRGSTRGTDALQQPLVPVFNNVLGPLHTTNWKTDDELRPPGIALQVGELDEAVAESVLVATLMGDAAAIAIALGLPDPMQADGQDCEAEPKAEEEADESRVAGSLKIVDAYGVEPLTHAAKHGYDLAVKVLLDAGADPHAACRERLTALQ
jgi:hypothetical protein